MKQHFLLAWINFIKSQPQKTPNWKQSLELGFAMPMAFALGLCMMALATTTVILAQEGRDDASLRQDNTGSLLVTDSAIAEILTLLVEPKNSVLLGKNYDPINPETGQPYLGPDGFPNTRDENNADPVDEWTGFNSYSCSASYGSAAPDELRERRTLGDGEYQVLAYRYDPDSRSGSLLVEGTYNNISNIVHLSLDVFHDSRDFPGILADSVLHWQGRQVVGKNGNLQFNPTDDDLGARQDISLDSSVAKGDGDRQRYLKGIWNSKEDGFAEDTIAGKIAGCNFSFYANKSGDSESSPFIPFEAQGTEIGDVNGLTPDLEGEVASPIKSYQADSVILEGADELGVDTTNGPVHLYVHGNIHLKDSAKIRQYRTDGRPPQVGDFWLIKSDTNPYISTRTRLEGTPCLENVFLYSPELDVNFYTTGRGCNASDNDVNMMGVIWAEDVENSAFSGTDYDSGDDVPPPVIPGTSGVEVPDDVSSLVGALESIGFPVYYRITKVRAWNQVSL